MTQATLMANDSAVASVLYRQKVLYVALELAEREWKLAFGDGTSRRVVVIAGRDCGRLLEEVEKAKERFRMVPDARVLSCYEAGREGFWLHRWLRSVGIENEVVDSASIERSARSRVEKTDRLDALKLLGQLIRYHVLGEREGLSVVRVPSAEAEDGRRLHRCEERLKRERQGHRARLEGLLAAQGLRVKVDRRFWERLEQARLWDGGELGGDVRWELELEWERLEVVERQLQALEAEQRSRLLDPRTEAQSQVLRLMHLYGIGRRSAWLFVMEFFGWRGFRNAREVGSLAGLVGTAHQSGDMAREQGISKAGNRRVRRMAVEIAWCWLRYQPQSALSQWYQRRWGRGGKRQRRVGVVALARRLLVALWRYLAHGELPEGARLKAAVVV